MGDKEKPDIYWKTFLNKRTYEMLRQGVMEEPGAGKYVTTRNRGMYYCAGCAAPLFHSNSKIDDGSGFASFQNAISESAIQLSSTYTQDGATATRLVCAECGGRLGMLSDMVLRSDEDLVQGTVQRTHHVSSDAIRLKKAVTPRNYPFSTILITAALAAGGFYLWNWGTALIDIARLQNTADVIPLWAGDVELYAKVIRLESVGQTDSSLLGGQQSLLVDVSGVEGTPRVSFANHPMDILWLNKDFVVLASEQDRPAESRELNIPSEARYLLIVQRDLLSEGVFEKGYALIVTDKSALF